MYHRVLVAGTFDRLHAGHNAVLSAAFGAGEAVTIGLTSDAFVQQFKIKNLKLKISPFEERKQRLFEWIAKNGFEDRVTIVPIDDPYEPAASEADLEVLIVTPDNKARGEEINRIRKEKGLLPLGLLVVPLVPAQDSHAVSSSRVREGEVDTSGRLILPDALRPELRIPLGNVLIGDAIGSSIEAHRSGVIVTVGDITTKTLLTAGVIPSLAIIDFQVKREPYPELESRFAALSIFRVNVASGPGFIATAAIEVLKKWSLHPEEKIVLAVSGEEDLLALPAIAYGPLSSVVYYGQPGQGVVEIIVTQEEKNKAIALLDQFSVK
jgi:cytidyltransferase-like protein